MSASLLSPVEEAIDAIAAGRLVIVVDDEDRENEGDLVIAAEHATSEAINFMATHGRGLICLAMEGALLDRLQIPMMVPQQQNRSGFGTGFTVSIEAASGVSTGISTPDRAHTIRTLIDPATTVNDIASPGHVFPLRARDGGVLERRGQTEASVDLARLAGLVPAGVICEVMREDGEMMRLPELLRFAGVHEMPVVSVEQLAAYRRARGEEGDPVLQRASAGEANGAARNADGPDGGRPRVASLHTLDTYAGEIARRDENEATAAPLVTLIGRSRLPTAHGEFDMTVFRDAQGLEHSALTRGTPGDGTEPPLVRLHSECLTGDAFGSLRCDCGPQLHNAMRRIHEAGRGAILYLRQEGRGIGLGNKIRAYTLQDEGLDTVEANRALGFPDDARRYEVAAAMLEALEIRSLRLLSNNPAKRRALVELGIDVAEGLPIVIESQSHNAGYLRTKVERMGHDARLVHGLNGIDEDALVP